MEVVLPPTGSSEVTDQPPVLVLDTTVFFDAPLLRGKRWPELLEHCRNEALRVVVPEVVIHEAVRHQSRSSLNAQKDAKALSQTLRRAGRTAIDLEAVLADLEEERRNYEDWLRGELVASGVKIHPWPAISHEELTRWTMQDRQPFKKDGSGYRDALVWATVLEVARVGGAAASTYLASANARDFAEDGRLAGVFEADLEALPNAPAVIWKRDLNQVLDDLSSYLISTRSPDPEPLRPSTEWSLVQSAVENQVYSLLGLELETNHDDERSDKPTLDLPPELESPTLQSIDFDIDTLVWHDHERFEGGTVIGEAIVEADISVEGFIHLSDWEPDGPYVAMDADWNDRFVWASLGLRVELTFAVNANPETDDVEEMILMGLTRLDHSEDH